MHASGNIDLPMDVFAMSPKVYHPWFTSLLLCVPRSLKYFFLLCCCCLSISPNVLPVSK